MWNKGWRVFRPINRQNCASEAPDNILGFGAANCTIQWQDARQASEEELKRWRKYETERCRQTQTKDEVITVKATVVRDKPKALPG